MVTLVYRYTNLTTESLNETIQALGKCGDSCLTNQCKVAHHTLTLIKLWLLQNGILLLFLFR